MPEHLDPLPPADEPARPAPAEVRRSMHPANWAVLVLPFGIAVGYLQVAMPYVLRLRGIDMAIIGGISAAANQPHAIKFFWAPVLDTGWPRRNWYFLTVALTALALFLASLTPAGGDHRLGPFSALAVYTVLLTAAQAAAATSSTAVLGIMASVVPEAEKGRASGWQTAGNLAGTAIGGAGIVWLLGHTTPVFAGAAVAAICVACALPALQIREPAAPRHGAITLVWTLVEEGVEVLRVRLRLRPLFALLWALLRDIGKTLCSRSGWTGLVICLSPVGTGAMINLFSALALDYSPDPTVRENMVLYATGILSGLVSAGGALAGGYVADRMNRRAAYVLFGFVTALCAVAMMIAPANPTAFTVGCLAYSFANGLCYAAFYAFVFDMVGKGQAATTKLALFISASNQAINYVSWLDGKAYDLGKSWWSPHAWAGRVGMLGMDALSTFVGIASLGLMMVVVKRLGVEKSATANDVAAAAT